MACEHHRFTASEAGRASRAPAPWLPVLAVLALGVARAGLAAGQDADPAPAEGAGAPGRALDPLQRIEALQILASGALPKVPLEQLLEVSLDDDSSMVARDDELRIQRRDAVVAARQARRMGTMSDDELRALDDQILAIDLERKVLALPIEVRERIVMLASESQASAPASAVARAPAPQDQEREVAVLAGQDAQPAPKVAPERNAGVSDLTPVEADNPRPLGLPLLFGVLALLGSAYWLLRTWTAPVCDAYLSLYPAGRLAAYVRPDRARGFGVAVSFAALLVVSPAMLARWARGSARKAPHQGRVPEVHAPPVARDAPELPKGLREALTLEPLREESPLLVDRFPGMSAFSARFEAWKKRGGIGTTLVVGQPGSGKTTWLHAAGRLVQGLPVRTLSLRERSTDPKNVRAALARACGLGEARADSADGLSQALLEGPKQVVCIDDLHAWFLRHPSGLDALEELERVMLAVGAHVYWVASIAHHAFGFIHWATKRASAFDQVLYLSPWTSAELEGLVQKRTAASGCQVTYEEQVVRWASDREHTRVLRTARDYHRFLWEYAAGSPRTALELWRGALRPLDGSRVSAGPFLLPPSCELEGLDEVGTFALGTIAWHGGIAPHQLPDSLRCSWSALCIELEKLLQRGVLVECDEQLTVSVAWWPAVMRYLVRKGLVQG